MNLQDPQQKGTLNASKTSRFLFNSFIPSFRFSFFSHFISTCIARKGKNCILPWTISSSSHWEFILLFTGKHTFVTRSCIRCFSAVHKVVLLINENTEWCAREVLSLWMHKRFSVDCWGCFLCLIIISSSTFAALHFNNPFEDAQSARHNVPALYPWLGELVNIRKRKWLLFRWTRRDARVNFTSLWFLLLRYSIDGTELLHALRNTSCTFNFSATNGEKTSNLRLSWSELERFSNTSRHFTLNPNAFQCRLCCFRRNEQEDEERLAHNVLKAVKTINSAGPLRETGEWEGKKVNVGSH